MDCGLYVRDVYAACECCCDVWHCVITHFPGTNTTDIEYKTNQNTIIPITYVVIYKFVFILLICVWLFFFFFLFFLETDAERES